MQDSTGRPAILPSPQPRFFPHAVGRIPLQIPHLAIHQVKTGPEGQSRHFEYLSEGFEWFGGAAAKAVADNSDLAYSCLIPEDQQRLARAEAAAAASGETLDINVRFEKESPGFRWCRILSTPRAQDDGSVLWDGVHIDITSEIDDLQRLRDLNGLLDLRLSRRTHERNRAQNSLSNLEKLTRIGSWVYDPSLPTLEWSEAVFEIFGLPLDQPPPTFEEFMSGLPKDQRSLIRDIISTQDFGRTWEYRLSIHRPDGSARTCWAEAQLERKEGSSEIILFGICRDLTDADVAEKMSGQSQKMEALGQLTSGLAHDFNNLLSINIGNLDLLKGIIGKDGVAHQYLENAVSAAIRGSELASQLLSLASHQIDDPKITNLNDLILQFQTLIDSSVGHGVRLIVELAERACIARIDAVQFESALLNLAINARDAMPHGGTLSIVTSIHVEDGSARGRNLSPGSYILTTVSDTGCGMPQEVIGRALEPFYTTKDIGCGTGLGLSMIASFAKRSDGHIEIRSQVGEGTSILLYLPCVSSPEDWVVAEREGDLNADDENLHRTILLVDDNPEVRRVTELLLNQLSYNVIVAASGIAALSLLRHIKADVLLTDILMKNMTGIQLASAVIEKYPGMAVVYTSGLGKMSLPAGQQVNVLSKPFTKAQLSSKMSQVFRQIGL